MIEVEIKARVLDRGAVAVKLRDLGARLIRREYHVDIYLSHPSRDFKSTDEALRLRVVNGEGLLTYKGPRLSRGVKAREEINVRVEPWERMLDLLKSLGFTEFLRIEKEREVYTYSFYTINLDSVKELGNFIEIETETNDVSAVEAIKSEMIKLLTKLGIGTDDLVEETYLELMLKKRGIER